MSLKVKARYEDKVLKPREAVDLEKGEKFITKVELFDIRRYYGVFGKGSTSEMRQFEEEVLI
jgi:predicted DNA-binding antitoxin AbrB/MazE fold protein